MRSVLLRRSSALLVLLVVISACGGGGSGATEPVETAPTSITSAPRTTATSSPPSTPPPATAPVNVFFSAGDGSDCSLVKPHERFVDAAADPILAAFEELATGPTDEEMANGAGSFFTVETAGAVRSATLADGLLIVDFDDVRTVMNNASTSCGSAALLASLNATAFQFNVVEAVQYAIEGDCSTFYNWLQTECRQHVRE